MTWGMEETAEMVVWVYTRETLTASEIVVWVVVGVLAGVVVATAPPTVLACYGRSLCRDVLGMALVRFVHDPALPISGNGELQNIEIVCS